LKPELAFYRNEKAPKEVLTALEASFCHFWKTPPSHFTPQKVKGKKLGWELFANER
jgi:hypothetical protein